MPVTSFNLFAHLTGMGETTRMCQQSNEGVGLQVSSRTCESTTRIWDPTHATCKEAALGTPFPFRRPNSGRVSFEVPAFARRWIMYSYAVTDSGGTKKMVAATQSMNSAT